MAVNQMTWANAGYAAVSGIASAYAANSQAASQARINNAIMRNNQALTKRRNTLMQYNARQQENMVTMQEINLKADHVKAQKQIQMQTLAAKGQADVAMNTMGVSGKTRDRLSKVVDTQASLALSEVNTNLEKGQLEALLKRDDIERARVQGKDYSLFFEQSPQEVNPLLAGLSSGVEVGLQTHARLGSDKPRTGRFVTDPQTGLGY